MNTEEVVSGSSPELETESELNNEAVSNEPGETEESLLSVVQSVSSGSDNEQPSGEEADASASDEALGVEAANQSDSPPDTGQTETEASSTGATQEDYSDVPFNKHPRFKELIREKNTYKAQVAEYESDAKQFRQLQEFMERHQLSPQEVAEGLTLFGEMKVGDPVKAYEKLSQKLEMLGTVAGKTLPEDLEKRIEDGYIDRETATQMYQQQMQARQQAAVAQSELARRQQQAEQMRVRSMADSVAAWEASTKANDPDFDIKADLVKDRVRSHLIQYGPPKSPEEALAISKQAYESVTQALRKAQGPKQPVRAAVGGKVNGSASPEPRNLLEVIRQAAAG